MADSKVVSLDEKREEKDPHLEGAARCMRCEHEWEAVSPVGSSPTGLQCPKCYAYSGIRLGLVARDDVAHLECGCGEALYMIYADDVAMCVNCGEMVGIKAPE